MFDAALGVQPRRAPVARRRARRAARLQPRAVAPPRPAPHERRLGGDAAVHRRPLERAVPGRRRGAAARAAVLRRPPQPPRPRRRGLRAAGVDPHPQARRPSGSPSAPTLGIPVSPVPPLADDRRRPGQPPRRAAGRRAPRRSGRTARSPPPVVFSASGQRPIEPAPLVAEHTDEILAELGSRRPRSPTSSPPASCAARCAPRSTDARRSRSASASSSTCRGGARCPGRGTWPRAISEALIGSVSSCRTAAAIGRGVVVPGRQHERRPDGDEHDADRRRLGQGLHPRQHVGEADHADGGQQHEHRAEQRR